MLHIRLPNERVTHKDTCYVAYELWDGDAFITACYGPAALGCLGAITNHLQNNGFIATGKGLELIKDLIVPRES